MRCGEGVMHAHDMMIAAVLACGPSAARVLPPGSSQAHAFSWIDS